MSLLSSRPALRWAVPAGVLAAALAAGGVGSVLSANAAPALPERSAAQLLVDLQNSKVQNFSGTIVEKADLGLPSLPAANGQGSSDLTSLVTGTHTMRVWYAGPDKARFALLGTLGESDVIKNKNDVWLWASNENKASHYKLAAEDATKKAPLVSPHPLPSTPQQTADELLKAIDPTTKVTTDGTAKVAGRNAYELVVTPKDTQSRVAQIRLAVDATEHVPLRVQVFAKGSGKPSFEIKFEQVSFAKPSEDQFRFTAPKGTTVTEEKQLIGTDHAGMATAKPGALASATSVVGKGWTSVLVLHDTSAFGPTPKSTDRHRPSPADSVLGALPTVQGSWGKGRLLESKLFSVLMTDDGRTLVGAVSPDRLYAAASDPAAAKPKATK
jgi:outer membrane lipoprotein-sorting protein